MSCTVVTEPDDKDDKTLLILWENEGNISIDQETLEKLSETEPTPVSVLRLSANPVDQELSDGIGNINITVKEVYPDIMARLVDPASDDVVLIQDEIPENETPIQSLEDILSPDEHATFLSWTVAFDHWYTGEPLPPLPSFLGPMLEVDDEELPSLPQTEILQPTIANSTDSTITTTTTSTTTATITLTTLTSATDTDSFPSSSLATSSSILPAPQLPGYTSPMGLLSTQLVPVRGRGRGRGRPRKDGSVSGTTRGRGRGEGRRGGRGRGAKPLPPNLSPNPNPSLNPNHHPLLVDSHMRPSLVPLVTPLMIAADESELRRNMTYRQAIIPVTDGKARLVALVPKTDEPRTDQVKAPEEAGAVEVQSVEPKQLLPTDREPVTNLISQPTGDRGHAEVQDMASITQPIPSPEKDRDPTVVDLESEVFASLEVPASHTESQATVAPPEDEVVPVLAASDSFSHVMQSVMRRRRGGGARSAGPLKLRDYDSELEDALAFVTADLDRQSPLQLRLSPPPLPPKVDEQTPEPPQEAPDKIDAKRTYKRRNMPAKLPSPPALILPVEEPIRREVKEQVKLKPQVNNRISQSQPQSQLAKVAVQPRTPLAQLPLKFPATPTMVVSSPGKLTQGHEGGHKRYPKRENRKAPAYLEKEFDSVLFSTPDIIRSVHTENTREHKMSRPDDRTSEKSPTSLSQDLIPSSRPAGGPSEPLSSMEATSSKPEGGGGEQKDSPPSPAPSLTRPITPQPDLARPGRSQPDSPEAPSVSEPTRGGKRGAKSTSPSLIANKKHKKSEDKRKQAKSRSRRQVQDSSEEEDVVDDEYGDGSESEDDPDRLWCLCRKPHNNRFMIRCDGCEDWFHGTCVGVTEAEGHRMENRGIYWSCPKCSENSRQEPDPVASSNLVPASSKTTATAASGKATSAPALAKAAVTPPLVKATLSVAQGKGTSVPAVAKAAPSPAPTKAAQAHAPTKVAQVPELAKLTQDHVPARAAQAPVVEKVVQAPASAKVVQAPVSAKVAQSPALAKAAQSPVVTKVVHAPAVAKAAQSPAVAKAAQATVPAKAAQATVPAKAAQATVPAKAAQSPAVAKAAQATVPAKAAQAPSLIKVNQAPASAKTTQVPALAKTAQAPAVGKTAQSPAAAKAIQAPVPAKTPVASLPAAAGGNISRREQMMARRQEAMQKSALGANTKPMAKPTVLKEKPDKTDEVQPQKSPASSPTVTTVSGVDPSVTNKPVAAVPGPTTKVAPAPRRELIFKAASSSEVSVRVYDKVTGKVLTGANAPKLAELKTWLEEHPTYEVAQRSLKPPSPTSSPAKREQQDSQTSPPEKNSAHKNVAAAVVGAPSGHKLSLPKPKDGDESQGKQRRDSVQEKQQAPQAKRQKRSGSVQNNKKQAVDADKDGGVKPAVGKSPSQASTKKEQSQPVAMVKAGSPKKVDSKRSTSSEHDKDEEKQKAVSTGPEPIRQNVCRSLQDLLLTRAKECSDLEVKEEEIQKITSNIEEEMYTLFRDTGLKYKAKYRSLVFNIKDPKNITLFRKIIEGLVTPYQLVRLTPEELASQELAQWREREVKHQLDMIKKIELDLLNNPKNYVVKTHKGELEIEKEPSEFAGPVAMTEATVSVDVVSSEGGLGFMEEEVVSAKEEVKHEKKEKHRHKDKKKHKKESKHKDREHKEKGEQHRHRDDQHKHRDSEHERKKSRDEEDKHRHREKDDHEKKKSKDKEEHTRHKESEHEKKRLKDREDKQKHGESEYEKKKIKSEEEYISKELDMDKKQYKEKEHRHREDEKEKKEFDEQLQPIDSMSVQEAHPDDCVKISVEKEVKDYQFFTSESNVDESLENFEQKLEESIQAEMKFENENSTDILENIPTSGDLPRSFLSIATPVSVPMESELGEESPLFDRDSNSSHSAGMSQKTKMDSHMSSGVLWSGYINMAGVSNVSTSAKLVYGNGKDLSDLLPSFLEVVGRIDPDTVWDYVSKVKRSGTKEILVLRLTSSGGEAKVSYCTLYKHLHSKNRLGVIGNLPEATRVKDFYIMPLSSHSPVPEQLLSLDAQIFEGPRPHILVCIIIRTVARQAMSFSDSSQLLKRSMDSSRCVTPSPDPLTPRYPLLQEVQPQFSDDSEGANSDTSSKQTSKVEAYVPKPVDSSKLNWKHMYPSASSNDSYAELAEDYGSAGQVVVGDDDPYSPGEDINETVELNTETRSSLDLQHTVDELDKIIDKRREEIKNISSAIGLASTVDVPGLETLQLMPGMADTTAVTEEDEAYSPSYSPPPREPAPSSSSLPPTILDILRNIPKPSTSPSPQKKPKLMDDSIIQSYGDKNNESDEEVQSCKQDDTRYSPSNERYSPSDENFSPGGNQFSPSDQCYSPPNAASLTFLNDDPQTMSLKEVYGRGKMEMLKDRLSGQQLQPGSESPPKTLEQSTTPAVATLDQPLPPGVETKEFPSYGTSFAQSPTVILPTGFATAAAVPPTYLYHPVTSTAGLTTGPPLQFVVPPPIYHPAPTLYSTLTMYPDAAMSEHTFGNQRQQQGHHQKHQRSRQRHQSQRPRGKIWNSRERRRRNNLRR